MIFRDNYLGLIHLIEKNYHRTDDIIIINLIIFSLHLLIVYLIGLYRNLFDNIR